MSAPVSSGSTPQRSLPPSLGPSPHEAAGTSSNSPLSGTKSTSDGSRYLPAPKIVKALSASKLANTLGPKMTTDGVGVKESYPMDKLLAKLSEQQATLSQQSSQHKATDGPCSSFAEHESSSNSLPMTPAIDAFQTTAPTTRPASATIDEARLDVNEVLRLKLQLAQAQNQISKLDQELAQSRTSEPDSATSGSGAGRRSAPASRDSPWPITEDSHSDTSDTMSASAFRGARGIWGHPKASFGNSTSQSSAAEPSPTNWLGSRTPQHFPDPGIPFPVTDGFRDRMTQESDLFSRPGHNRRGPRYDSRGAPSGFVPAHGPGGNYFDSMGNNMSGPTMSMNHPQAGSGMVMYPQYQQQAAGTALSPHASEFTSKAGWKTEKYIVDKIVCNNDQQASIFLQQKLKVGTPEQKYEIVEAIVAQAYPLMVNRFGNFLVQRCFEHGTPEQVIKIAEAIRGNTLSLSMDPFGCHVVQKAFDSVPENYKAIMVHELLRRIPETVIHRYACHVWQKLFELRWTESPPQIMTYVNEALRGMWHEVALGETGSLVVQNIFENCLEEDKRPCIEEVLANIDIVAHGQFGNWCIQHVCEHGAPPDRSRAIDHVIRYASEYSTDQFASKVVEKCLKIGGTDFLGRYLDRVCEGRRDRTRIPLIDIASDQYGNYLIQWILNNAAPQHREMVAAHIRKHMVSLRGSKFGSRVGMLCTNHAVTTRPGHGAGPSIPGRLPGPRYGANYR
ncbi:Pumilio-family RNA binding repeat protein [Cordyceps fumosorosea ARSEF 2679]|uniref:Pumilio-family RNA binding repeat protein n=1 Tax=Cordyceps fumosorosea (strain ARSEF 2679) TaxID=1081104 RepID=A0A167SAX8_CORFA|nr:Pumilio-family RNA binding repeat protein [Cordyceps fumosorosea ARSEF 2679]OAA59437.1 Pumilio-family RNA binding repeat protein [Cordyceps fumosorosea ARSEF 2679]